MAADLLTTFIMVAVVVVVSVAYSVRVALRGRAHYERVNRQGGSVLLSKSLMEMAYWSLQPVAGLLTFLGLTPNQLSWGSLGFGALAGLSLAVGHFGYAAVFGALSALLDSLDGIVARITNQCSDAGEVLDAAVDRYVEFFFLAGLAYYYREAPALLLLSLAAIVGSFMVSYSSAKAEALHLEPPTGIMRRPERGFYLILGAALSPIPLPWLDGVFGGMRNPTGYPMVASLILVAVLANAAAVVRFWRVASMARAKKRETEQSGHTLAGPHLISDDGAWILTPQKT